MHDYVLSLKASLNSNDMLRDVNQGNGRLSYSVEFAGTVAT